MQTERSPPLWPGSRPCTAVCTPRLSPACSPWGSRRSCDLSCRLLPTRTAAPPCPGLPGVRVSQQRTVPGTWLHPTCPAAPLSPQADWNLLGATLTDYFTQALGSAALPWGCATCRGGRMSKRGSPMNCGGRNFRKYTSHRKAATSPDSTLRSRDITFPTKVCRVKATVFPAVTYGCESWTVKKAECRRLDAFELWCWRRLLRVPWTARRSSQSILKDISPGCSLEGLMLKLKLQYFGHLM